MACICNPATLEADFQNGVGSVPFGGNSPPIGREIVTSTRRGARLNTGANLRPKNEPRFQVGLN